jgi:predicted amidophosphoribosyltransferase
LNDARHGASVESPQPLRKEHLMICPKCSNENPGHARFCGKCGHAIVPLPPPDPPQPPSDKVASFFKGVGYFFTGFIVLGMVASSCSGY